MPQARYIGPNTHVLHLENIDEEWKSLALSLGDVPHLNISRPKQEYVLDDQSKEIIQKEFPNDFEPFGYEK